MTRHMHCGDYGNHMPHDWTLSLPEHCPGVSAARTLPRPDPGQRYRLSEDAAAEVAVAVVYGGPNPAMPYLTLNADGVTLDPWPDPATETRSTSKPYASGPSPSPATEPAAQHASAYTETAPSPQAQHAQHGTSATTTPAPPSPAPNTADATGTKAQYEATTSEH